MQWSIVVANDNALQTQAELLSAVLRGCRRSYRYAADNRDEWAAFGARHFGIPATVMARSIAREIEDLHFDNQIDLPGLTAAIALQRKLGGVTRELYTADIADLRFQA
jgi:ABC-type nitrate/sulfonate/bicarbonate transport system substrate-binding protein